MSEIEFFVLKGYTIKEKINFDEKICQEFMNELSWSILIYARIPDYHFIWQTYGWAQELLLNSYIYQESAISNQYLILSTETSNFGVEIFVMFQSKLNFHALREF